jgi:hypothetical protein
VRWAVASEGRINKKYPLPLYLHYVTLDTLSAYSLLLRAQKYTAAEVAVF